LITGYINYLRRRVDGLKRLLLGAGVTLKLIIGLDYQQVADMLHTDPYVGKLIVDALHKACAGKKSIS
jgi:hypothetical protein